MFSYSWCHDLLLASGRRPCCLLVFLFDCCFCAHPLGSVISGDIAKCQFCMVQCIGHCMSRCLAEGCSASICALHCKCPKKGLSETVKVSVDSEYCSRTHIVGPLPQWHHSVIASQPK